MSNFHTSPFQNSAIMICLDLIHHNIGITFCHHLYLSATLSHVSHDLLAMKPPSILFTDERSTKFLRAI